MKKCIAFTLAIMLVITSVAYADQPFDVRVPELTALKTDTANATALKGTVKGLQTLDNASFTDIRKTYGQEAVVRLATFGIIKQFGNRKYAPSSDATGFEALTQLVRMLGADEQVMTRVNAKLGASTSQDLQNRIINEEMLAEAQNRGIVLANEVLGLTGPIAKEKLSVWTARAIGQAPVNAQTTVFSFSDWQNVNPAYRNLIEGLVTDGIVGLKNDGSFGPKNNVSKGELAAVVGAAFETQYAAQGIVSGYGIVIGVKPETLSEPNNKITRNTVTVRNTDGTVTNLVSESHTKGLQQFDYVVFKDGLMSSNKIIKLGDEVAYHTQNGELKYVEVLDHNLVIEKIEASLPTDPYSIFHFGTLSDIRKQTTVKKGKSVITEIYRVVDVSGDVFDIIVDEDTFTGQRDDIITYKDGKIAGVKVLAIGDVMEYLVNDKNEVSYIKVAPLDKNNISGTVREMSERAGTEPATVTIYGYDNQVYKLPIAPYGGLFINGMTADVDDFVYGMPVKARVVSGYVLHLEGESYTGEPGFIPAFGKMRIGDVTQVYQNSFTIQLATGARETVTLTPQTVITKSGNVVDIKALKPGIPVKLYFDDISSTNVSKVEVEAPEILFEIIYKGKMKTVNGTRSEIQLTGTDGVSKPEYISNNSWLPAETFNVNLKVDDRTEIYAGNQKLTMTDLNRKYSGYPTYAVVKSVYGQPTVVKLSVMTGGETLHSSTVKVVDHTLDSFEINTKENFNLTEGTIVIKDGLVVPNEILGARDTVFVVSESPMGTYAKNAMVVKVVTPYDNIFNSIRIGAIEEVNPSTFTMKNHTQYFNNFINAVNPNATGYYKFYTSSVIEDVTDSAKKLTLNPSDFWHKSYARSENVDPTYSASTPGLQFERYYAFMVVNDVDSSVVAMKLRHKGLLPGQNIDDTALKETDIATQLDKTYQNAVLSRGIVTSKDTTWSRIEITDSHDWTDYTGRWTANRANIFVRYTDTIIVKNNQVKTIEDIKPGDYIYIMRIKDQALVIFIEN